MDKEIGRVPKHEQADIVVKVDTFAGRAGVSIREWAKSDRYTGFTKSGTKIPVSKFEEFKQLINSISPEDLKAAEAEAEAEAGSKASKGEEGAGEGEI